MLALQPPFPALAAAPAHAYLPVSDPDPSHPAAATAPALCPSADAL